MAATPMEATSGTAMFALSNLVQTKKIVDEVGGTERLKTALERLI
jgi:hypothetical protein